MFVMLDFVLTGNRLMQINAGAVLDLLPSQFHMDVKGTPSWAPKSYCRD